MTVSNYCERCSVNRPFIRAVPTVRPPLVRAEAKFAVKLLELQERQLREQAEAEWRERGCK
ncbi:MAG: hypothetical protein ACJ8F7_02630 [Gemmataceae bacterium]